MAIGAVVVAVAVAACGGSSPRGAAPRTSADAPSGRVTRSADATTTAPASRERILRAAAARLGECASGRRDAPHPFFYSGLCRDVPDYGVPRLWSRGIDGSGTTIAVMEYSGDPSIERQVAAFDRPLGLPNPQVTVEDPTPGVRRPLCPRHGGCASVTEPWLDVLAAHVIAPYARILVAVTPADQPQDDHDAGEAPQVMQGVEAIARLHLADVVSLSLGDLEPTDRAHDAEVTGEDPGLLAAAADGIPVVAATGDCGPVAQTNGSKGPCATVTRRRDVSNYADSPWALAVGGSAPSVNPSLDRILPGEPAESAGFSSIYARPAYQAGVSRGRMRSEPDITMDGAYGTSQAAPLMAGILALATQADGGRDVGPVDPALYEALGPRGTSAGVDDVTRGDDSLVSGGRVVARGFAAHRGFDVASGWGTIDAPRFVPALVRATRADGDERAARAQATAVLAGLRHAVRFTRTGAGERLAASGFLPGFPVTVAVDGRPVATRVADGAGDVEATIGAATFGRRPGAHAVVLRGTLIAVSGRFTTR